MKMRVSFNTPPITVRRSDYSIDNQPGVLGTVVVSPSFMTTGELKNCQSINGANDYKIVQQDDC